MKVHQIENMLGLLSSFLGDSLDKDRDYNVNEPDSLQFRFNCPHCAEENGGTPDNKYNLEIKDEDYMGITAYSIYQDREKIAEFFNTEEYSKMEEVYWFIKNNYKE